MNHDDSFEALDNDDERTVIKPIPGGIRRTPREDGFAPPPAGTVSPPPSLGHGLNPLENAATTLLMLLMRIKNTPTHPDPEGLRRRMIQELKTFKTKARERGVSEKNVRYAHYILCTALDEAVLNTPWGHACDWSEKSLLSTFHNETWGGEKVFKFLEAFLQDPAGKLDLLELMYLILSFGFEGQYRVLPNGRARLEQQREYLYRVVRRQRGDFERELSPHWRGVSDRRNALVHYAPWWVIAAVAGLLLLLAYWVFSILLNRISDPVYVALSNIRGDTVAMVERDTYVPPPPPPRPPVGPTLADRFRAFLEPEIRAGLVKVLEDRGAETTTVRILGDGLFDSGSAEVKPTFIPLLRRIAEELRRVPGKVLVTGHTDSIPIRTLRFPSNWHLSKARADAVLQILNSVAGSPERFFSEGRAATEPVASNKTPEGRALNRRVDITLLTRTPRIKVSSGS